MKKIKELIKKYVEQFSSRKGMATATGIILTACGLVKYLAGKLDLQPIHFYSGPFYLGAALAALVGYAIAIGEHSKLKLGAAAVVAIVSGFAYSLLRDVFVGWAAWKIIPLGFSYCLMFFSLYYLARVLLNLRVR